MEKQNTSKNIFAILIIILIITILIGTWITLNTTNLFMIKPKAETRNVAYGKIVVSVEEQKNKEEGKIRVNILPRPE
ncbi:MAG: hypothetical protein QXM27_01360 [Candidatus Pacearchaeota archaeon]